MTFEELVRLYILQKDYHEKGVAKTATYYFPKAIETLYSDYAVEVSTEIAPPLDSIEGQLPVPYVIFRPKKATGSEPRPVIVHTHGGPKVYFEETTPHAEIAYFLTQGYVVVCPNYRGSNNCPTDYPDKKAWKVWESKAGENPPWIAGAEDVYAVTQAIIQKEFIDKSKIMLRGGSFGSHVNAWLLAEIKKGRFEQCYVGAHLSGGLLYPPADAMPEAFPLLVTHAVNDDIAAFTLDTKQFFINLLKTRTGFVQTYVSQSGGHHFIHPSIGINTEDSFARKEMNAYLQLMLNFVDTVMSGKSYQVSDVDAQLAQHLDPRLTMDIPDDKIIQQFHEYIQSQIQNVSLDEGTEKPQILDSSLLSPTMAHIKLFLGDRFSGQVKEDLRLFFTEYYKPRDYIYGSLVGKIEDAGQQILSDEAFFQQLVRIVEFEQEKCNADPEHMVLYHACNYETLLLYCFIQLWRESLSGVFKSEVDTINMLRMYDFTSASFANIHSFLKYMRENYTADLQAKLIYQDEFNYASGFSERALACNPSLTSNSQCTASSSLWWYFHGSQNTTEELTKRIITEFLSVLGIYQPEKVQRYLDLINKEVAECLKAKEKQGALFQFTVPYAVAEEKGYVCEMFGKELKETEQTVAKPSHLKFFREDPETFETSLKAKRGIFNNPEKQNQDAEGFKFADQLQVRMMYDTRTTSNGRMFIRRPLIFQKASREMAKLVQEDCSYYLAASTKVPEVVVAGADSFKTKLRTGLGFENSQNISEELLLVQQRALHQHATQNVSMDFFCHIWKDLSKDKKSRIQDILYRDGILERERIHLFKLCNYIRGYTYYDLLMMMVEQSYGHYNKIKDEYDRRWVQDDYEFLVKMIEHFSNPLSVNEPFYDTNYVKLKNLLFHNNASFNLSSFECYTYQNRSATSIDLAAQDFSNARMCVMNYALLAKQKTYKENTVDMSLLKPY